MKPSQDIHKVRVVNGVAGDTNEIPVRELNVLYSPEDASEDYQGPETEFDTPYNPDSIDPEIQEIIAEDVERFAPPWDQTSAICAVKTTKRHDENGEPLYRIGGTLYTHLFFLYHSANSYLNLFLFHSAVAVILPKPL